MRKHGSAMAYTFLLAVALLTIFISARAQNAPPAGPKTAAQQFKNIQVMKDIPAEDLIPAMQFISASLGVECTYCHVEHAMDKDDKKEKKFARRSKLLRGSCFFSSNSEYWPKNRPANS